MFRVWKFIFLSMLFVLLLTGCSGSLEDKAAEGITVAEEVFISEVKERTDEVEGIKLYKPSGFVVDEKSDAQNIVLNHNDQMFILFINPNETEDSSLFHDLLLKDESKEIIDEKTFTENGVFGFAAVVSASDENFELIASAGKVKITTISKKKHIANNLAQMMEIVRSVKQEIE